MGRYIGWDFLAGRYPHVSRVGDAKQVESYYIPYAEAELEGRLGVVYTTPFTGTNLTAKELAADLVYLRMAQFKDAEERGRFVGQINARMKRLLNGDEGLTLADGTVVYPSQEAVWSDNQGYHPAFGLDDPLDWTVDSDRLQDLEDDRDG
jgi:hypothetical protein